MLIELSDLESQRTCETKIALNVLFTEKTQFNPHKVWFNQIYFGNYSEKTVSLLNTKWQQVVLVNRRL